MSWFSKRTQEKPEDVVEYRIGFCCEDQHPQSRQSFSRGQLLGDSSRREICRRCGKLSYPSVVRVIQGSHLYEGWFSAEWVSGSYVDLTTEFVRYLDEDSNVKLSDEILTKIKVRAARDMTRQISNEELPTYSLGLQDGETMTALWLLGEIQKETK